MPELPEVENVKRGLERLGVPGQTVRAVDLLRPNLRTPLAPELRERLPGQTIRTITRRAKFLLFELDHDVVISHLGMTGSWRAGDDEQKHDHVRWHFHSGLSLIFNDPRRFGILEVVPRERTFESVWLKNLAPEPLGPDFTADYLYRVTRGSAAPIKAVLMDAKRVVGVGNIYASEVLHRAGVRPTRAAGRVTKAEILRLTAQIVETLGEAIAAGGSTIRDYKNSEGAAGAFQDQHRVYGRDGRACRACAGLVKARVIAGRSTYWCPRCQPR